MPQYDVIVIAAGISGLTVAKNLQDNNVDCIILEVNAHIGGRCWAKDGIDLGASWVHSCEGTEKFKNVADFTVCKNLCCDSIIDPDVDIVYGVPSSVLKEYSMRGAMNVLWTLSYGMPSAVYLFGSRRHP